LTVSLYFSGWVSSVPSVKFERTYGSKPSCALSAENVPLIYGVDDCVWSGATCSVTAPGTGPVAFDDAFAVAAFE
jgi:hypothetical protein